MITEILGFFIILGAILVLVVKQISKRQQITFNDVNDMRESTEQLKLELQRSADSVINRMGGHIAHLEKLLQEADERNLELTRQLRAADEAENKLRRYANEIEQQMLSWRQTLVTAPNLTNTNAALRAYTESVSSPPERERLDATDFASVLQQSIARDGQPKQVESLTAAMNEKVIADVSGAVPEEEPAVITDNKMDTDAEPNLTAKASALLRSGYSVEAVAKETGLGKGAIQLLKEMNRRELEA